MTLFHYEGGNGVDVTSSLDINDNIICGTVTSLSPFIVAENVDTTIEPVLEFTTIAIPVAATLGLLVLIRRRRQK